MICKKCGKPIDTSAKVCPYCGSRQDKENIALSPMPKTQTRTKKYPVFVAVLIAVVAVVLIAKGCMGGPNNSTVISCAESLISQQLKAPSTASYSNAKIIDHDNYGRYLVYAEVNAQNSFGAYLHSSYVVLLWNVKKNGECTYNSLFSVESLDSMDESTAESELKSLENWGKPLSSDSNSSD